jgi:NitT/TauT family transport system substrate-binding protein
LPTLVARDKGLFEKHGLKIEFVTFSSGPAAGAGVESGSVEILSWNSNSVMVANSRGATFRGLVENFAGPIYSLVARTDLNLPNAALPYPRNLVDLKGLKIGVSARGADTELFGRALLGKVGLTERDVTFVGVGQTASAVAALKTGQVDVVIQGAPVDTILVEGEKAGKFMVKRTDLAKLDPVFKNWDGQAYMVSAAADKEPGKYIAFAQAIADADKFITDPKNIDDVVAIYGKELKTLPVEIVKQLIVDSYAAYRPSFSCEAVMNAAQFSVTNGQLEASKAPKDCKDYVWKPAQDAGFLISP